MTPAEVRAFTPLVKACARRFAPSSLPASIDHDDLESVCWRALIEAELSFDPKRGPFEAWAWAKMRGAVLDEVRRQRAGTKRQAVDEPLSFEDSSGDTGRPTDEAAQASMDVRELVLAIAGLPENERRALIGRLNGRLGADIGEELGVTRSRVSQLNSAAIGRLRNQVAA